MILENSEISFNNFAHFNSGWESGGLKIMKSRNLVIRNNRVCNNDGAGLLTEWDNFNTLYEGNTVTNNSILGIAHFTSGKAVIRNNIVRNNGTENSVWLWNGQIILRSSRDIDISSNTVEVAASGGNGITIIQQNAGSGIHGPFVSVNNFCHDNDITMCGRTGLNGAAADFGKDTMLNGHNRFDANRYHVTSTNEAHWNWDTPKTWQEFRAAGHEVHGTVDEKMPSRGDSVKLEFRIMKTERMLKSMHSASELKRATPITKGRLEQKIAKFAKKENNEPFAAFAAFCSNLLSFTDSDMFPSSPGRLRRTSRVSIFGFRMLTVSVIHMDSDEQ
jgi:parallel beta-helix repeat protein